MISLVFKKNLKYRIKHASLWPLQKNKKNTEVYTAESLSNSGHNLQNIDQLSGQMMKET